MRWRNRVTVLIAVATLSLAGELPAGAVKEPATQSIAIDINSATLAQLMTLPGIGNVEAHRIIAGRPYLTKAGLVTDKIIPAGTYQAIRHRIIAIQHGMPNRSAQSEPSRTN